MDQAAEQPHSQFGDMNLVQLEHTFGFLAVNPSLTNTSILASAIGQFFSETTFTLPQVCAYARTSPFSTRHTTDYDLLIRLRSFSLGVKYAEPRSQPVAGRQNKTRIGVSARKLFRDSCFISELFRTCYWAGSCIRGIPVVFGTFEPIRIVVQAQSLFVLREPPGVSNVPKL